MSKLLDLLAQQHAITEQQHAIAEKQNAIAEKIKALKADEKEAKVLKFVEDLEALRNKHGYSVPDFIDVVHSIHNFKTPAKNVKSVNEDAPKAPKAPTEKWKVKIDGVEFILKRAKQGIASQAMKDKGFKTYALFLADLMKKNEVDTFEALIGKLKAEKI